MASEPKKQAKPAAGKRATVIGTPVVVRCQDPFLNAVDDWRSRQRPIPSRPDAIRQLAAIGLRRGKKVTE